MTYNKGMARYLADVGAGFLAGIPMFLIAAAFSGNGLGWVLWPVLDVGAFVLYASLPFFKERFKGASRDRGLLLTIFLVFSLGVFFSVTLEGWYLLRYPPRSFLL